MTVKTRGIKLKSHLPPEDQGQQKLLQVTYSQLEFMGRTQERDESKTPASRPRHMDQNRRRAIARMLRIELEATLSMLDEALAGISRDD